MTTETLDSLASDIRGAVALGSLKIAINRFDVACMENELDVANEMLKRGVYMCALPTFRGAVAQDARNIWSWDETHLLVGEGVLDIVSREDWADALDRYHRGVR